MKGSFDQLKYRQTISRLLIFFFSSLFVLFLFHNFLSFPNEAFYMGLPIYWLLFLLIYRKQNLKRWIKVSNILKGLGCFLFIWGYFWYLSSSMGWKIISKEVFLAAYFLLAVGIVIHWIRLVIRLIADSISRTIKNKKIKKVVYGATFFILWCLAILPYIVATFTIHRPKIGDQIDPLSEYGWVYKDVFLQTKDNVRLHGWFVPLKDSDKGVVIGHGLGANKSNFLPLVKLWRDMDYNVLIFDFRGHGQSQGHTLAFGLREKYDILAAVDYLCAQKTLDPQKIVGYGVSFGAASVIHAAAEDQRIRAVVVDSSFADVDVMARKVIDSLFFLPVPVRGFFAKLGIAFVNLELGFDIREASPMKVIKHLKGRPLYLIHGIQDTLVPFNEAQKLYAYACMPKEYFWINTPGHYATLVNPLYAYKINNFLDKYGL